MNRKIIITVLSPIKEPNDGKIPDIIDYSSDCTDIIKSDWSSGAGLLYLLRTVPDCTDVICMCSKEVNNTKHINKVREIISICGCENIEPRFIEYQTDTPLVDITNSLVKEFAFENSDTVYLDTTGGFRSVVYSLVYLFRYFEYMNIRIDKAIYSSLKGTQGRIEDIKNTFRMFDLINGAHEFTTSGNPQTLINFFRSSTNPKIALLLDCMTDFYNAMCLCRLNNISSIVKKLNKTLNDLMHDTPKDFDETLFINLIPAINEKFYSSGKFTYLSLIKWCLSNNLLQQAITIYVEKIPRAYFKELKFLSVSDDKLEKKSFNPGTDIYVEYFLASTLNVKSDDHLSEMSRIIDENLSFVLMYSYRRNFNKLFMNSNYSPECKHKFETIVNIRDTFYDNSGIRLYYTQNDKLERELLAKLGMRDLSQLPKNVDKLLEFLKNNHYAFRSEETDKKTDSSKDSKSIINNYQRAVNSDLSTNITLSIDSETLKKLRLDYLYTKYARNQINHASEDTDNEPTFKKLMSENYGYTFPEDNNFSAVEIRNFLKTSTEFIENITIKKESE